MRLSSGVDGGWLGSVAATSLALGPVYVHARSRSLKCSPRASLNTHAHTRPKVPHKRTQKDFLFAPGVAPRVDQDPVLTQADALDQVTETCMVVVRVTSCASFRDCSMLCGCARFMKSNARTQLVARVASWVSAAETLRSNIKAVAECEKQNAARLRKLVGIHPVGFAQAPAADVKGSEKSHEGDTLAAAARGCFYSVPTQMAAMHEEIASNLVLLDSRQGKELEKLARKHRAAIEAVVFSVYDKVEKAREELEARAVALQTLVQSGDEHAEVWLAQVQQAAARREEREASALYCQQAQSLWEAAQQHETELAGKMREVMSGFIGCQSVAVGKVDLTLEALSRTMKSIDAAADWKTFAAQERVAAATQEAVSPDWRDWRNFLSETAVAEERKGDAMSAGSDDRLLCAGYLQRQGSMLGFNWKKNYFVVTREGFLYYFLSRNETKPEASFFLPSFKPEVQVDPSTGIMTVLLHPKSKSFFSVSGPSKVVVRVDTSGLTVTNGLILSEWKNAIMTAEAGGPLAERLMSSPAALVPPSD